MKGGSCFSGVGGLDKGLEEAGVEVVWQIEIDSFRRKVLEKHWPSVPRYEDITKVSGDELEDVDILFGGFPCQDLSTAGKRKGLTGERSSLFFEFARLAGVLLPRWLLIENVSGLLSSDKGGDMGIVIETLSELGYGVGWRVLDSQYFGVPQRRRRVYIVGHLGAPCPPAVLFERKGREGDPPQSGKAGEGVAFALAASARGTGDGHGNAWNSTDVFEDIAGKQSGDGRVGIGVREETMYTLQRGHQHGVAMSLRSHPRPGSNSSGSTVVTKTDIHPPVLTQGRTPDVGDGSDLHRRVVIANSLRECDGHHGRSSPRGDGSDNQVVGRDIPHSLGASGRGVDEPTGTTYLVESVGANTLDQERARKFGGDEKGILQSDSQGNGVCPEAHTNGVSEAPGVPRSLGVSLSCVCKDTAQYSAYGDAVTVNVARWLGVRLTVVDELMYGEEA